MSYYTVRRDDSELRVVTCPKCLTADVVDTREVVPYRVGSWLLRLMQCSRCGTFFTFYREDGIKEISEQEAVQGLEKGRQDMQADGQDCHGHSFYIVFKCKPKSMSCERYDDLCGFKRDEKGDYGDRDAAFAAWVDRIPTLNQIVRYHKMLQDIDFDNMPYLDDAVCYDKDWDASQKKEQP